MKWFLGHLGNNMDRIKPYLLLILPEISVEPDTNPFLLLKHLFFQALVSHHTHLTLSLVSYPVCSPPPANKPNTGTFQDQSSTPSLLNDKCRSPEFACHSSTGTIFTHLLPTDKTTKVWQLPAPNVLRPAASLKTSCWRGRAEPMIFDLNISQKWMSMGTVKNNHGPTIS